MARSFIEIIYIDLEDNARQTNMSAQLGTDAQTWAEFNRLRCYVVGIKEARFLLDYHNVKGDLSDTIPIDISGFVAVTGQQPKSDQEYVKFDEDFWNKVRTAAA